MTDHTDLSRVQRMMDALPPAARAAAERQLPFALDRDDQMAVVTDAWIFAAELAQPTADRVSQKIRDRQWRERHDARAAGWALDSATLADFGDPSSKLEDLQRAAALVEECRALGLDTPAAPASIRQEPALPVAEAARWCRRCLRSVQIKMREVCRRELAGQGVLPGVPLGRVVYTTRGLGVGHD
jgi:hypothetical protein